MIQAADDVVFDYEGALALARNLWQLADHTDALRLRRQTQADATLVSWVGTHAVEFERRVTNEQSELTHVAECLRADAQAWALQWKRAMDTQNKVIYARHVDDKKASRSLISKVGDLFGGPDYPPEPAPVPVPQPPLYVSCAQLVRYS
ncbi:MAG: hypothetical protein ACT4OX_00495 [Actinomycetota bacterium]